jgi:hypothetical protein
MKKRILLIGLMSVLLVVTTLAVFLGILIAHWREQPPLFYYTQLTISLHELPTRLIRPAFHWFTGRELPKKADGVRAIIHGGTDPSLFVRFETDSDGIEHIKHAFSEARTSSEYFDRDTFKNLAMSERRLFPIVSRWQERIGVCLIDEKSIESGLSINSAPGPPAPEIKYSIFIDDGHSTVYIFVVMK